MSSSIFDRNSIAKDASSSVQPDVAGEKVNEKQAEEASGNTFVETLLEEILNDWAGDGPFVHRLKAYQTPSGQIIIQEETVVLRDGTELEMAPFAGCAFEAGFGAFVLYSGPDGFIHLIKNRIIAKTTDFHVEKGGLAQKLDIANKAIRTNVDDAITSYVFRVRDEEITYTNCNRCSSHSTSPRFQGDMGPGMNVNLDIFESDGDMVLNGTITTSDHRATPRTFSVAVTNVFSGATFNRGAGQVGIGGNFTSKGDMHL